MEGFILKRIGFSTLEKNADIVKNVFGSTFYNKSLNDTLSLNEVLEANGELLRLHIGEQCAQLVHKRDVVSINNLMWNHQERFELPFKRNDDDTHVGIVVVRPEAQWFEDDIILWLEKHDIQVIEYYKTTIDFWMHWYLYFCGFVGIFEDRPDFPTRMLNYDNQMLHAMMVKFKNNSSSSQGILKFLSDRKGTAGLPKEGFIRGEVCFNAFQQIIEDSGKSLIQQARVVLDPIGMYRKIARGESWCDNDNLKSSQVLVFYTGLSVHSPDENEAQKHKRIFRLLRER